MPNFVALKIFSLREAKFYKKKSGFERRFVIRLNKFVRIQIVKKYCRLLSIIKKEKKYNKFYIKIFFKDSADSFASKKVTRRPRRSQIPLKKKSFFFNEARFWLNWFVNIKIFEFRKMNSLEDNADSLSAKKSLSKPQR